MLLRSAFKASELAARGTRFAASALPLVMPLCQGSLQRAARLVVLRPWS
eukprot:CAMPEP_0204225276 /NCGR_PEP_ID=MMETSP0361-20130328/84090_1 /ASSEMBLY_ACC=CAM_ASM_000343 /TAXON_ID=268821 /ORGANISM="Scrippsiella Hangoei, Strain SHTV-5" /LENGTH=48 /DNA_ID= /DNA_START= /DNA_END= /DNA_ORIENTATION=